MATPAILGLGNPLLDISVTVPDLTLATKYALKMGDACLASPAQAPLYDELAADPAALYIAGGATQNSIRVAQWVSGAAPGYAAFVGSVGDDAFGAKLRAAAAADGVAVLYQTQPAGGPPTGTCAVLVHEKERSLCANLAAAEALTAAHLEAPAVAAAVAAARIYYAAGFPLTHDGGAASALKLGELAAENGKTFAVNLSAPFICQFFKDRLAGVLNFADFVFGNEAEAAAWGAANGLEGASVEAVARAVAALPKAGAAGRTVVFTQGAKETVIATADGAVHTVPVDAIADSEIVDVNGAGDAFVGGFLAATAAGKDVDVACRAGNWAAGVVIRRSGCAFDATLKCPAMA